MKRFLFVGPDAKHFKPTSVKAVEKLIWTFMNFEMGQDSDCFFEIRPDSGFAVLVAKVLKEYKVKKVFLVSEFKDDFSKLPVTIRESFYELVRGDGWPDRLEDCPYALCTSNYTSSQWKAAYPEFLQGYERIVYYNDERYEVNKRFSTELATLEKNRKPYQTKDFLLNLLLLKRIENLTKLKIFY